MFRTMISTVQCDESASSCSPQAFEKASGKLATSRLSPERETLFPKYIGLGNLDLLPYDL